MLFKILQGNELNLPSTLTDGYCYFLKDKHYFYVDHKDSSNNLVRSKLSAEYADKLRYINDDTMVEISPEDLALKSEVAAKADKATTLAGYGITDAYTKDEVNAELNAINYAGSSTHGGSANSAVKLDSSAGTATQPVYFEDGKPKATTYELLKTVPADAKFTDTVYDDTDVRGLIGQKADASTVTTHTSDADIHVTASDKATWNAKQNTLTFDSTPTANSTNPVTSGGVYTALEGKQPVGDYAPAYTYGTEDIQAGSASTEPTGTLHFVIE